MEDKWENKGKKGKWKRKGDDKGEGKANEFRSAREGQKGKGELKERKSRSERKEVEKRRGGKGS